jgi:hypothetical protein
MKFNDLPEIDLIATRLMGWKRGTAYAEIGMPELDDWFDALTNEKVTDELWNPLGGSCGGQSRA